MSIAWYEAFTPLRLLRRHEDELGQGAWLCHPEPTSHPFVLVLVDFNSKHGLAQPHLRPFAHLGFEMPNRADVDAIAERGRLAGCLGQPPVEIRQPVGYVCTLSDPDGNMIEFSYDQRVYDAVGERYGLTQQEDS